ncbi:DNA-binding protein [Pelobium manganitolerans]|uniref:DNA-binding protein n=1 Tax=Pelobium manganitolerans TaxID=1842495 RepID=A0A419S542_9SPHI|nr:glycosyl hydrolase [Pelobium manganitolerans]RKD15228.1 DNA-binding protein [Pelobium manganitolerans]
MIFCRRVLAVLVLLCALQLQAQENQNAKPLVMWYWVKAGVSKAGITADLEAMKQAGIGGAYLAFIQSGKNNPPYTPIAEQLSPEWWEMVTFAVAEAKRLDLKITMHVSDGFALAGGPWITPELSMQKVVFSRSDVTGGRQLKLKLTKPKHHADYYEDIRVFAFPSLTGAGENSQTLNPEITASTGENVDFLVRPDGKQSFRSSEPAYITYQFAKPFTLRNVRVESNGNNYQAQRLLLQTSTDGLNFTNHQQLQAPRHGWQDTDEEHTYSIKPVTAKYFRFVYNKEGSLPADENLDAAKWKPSLKLTGLQLFSEPVINQFESKNGGVWRISERTTEEEISNQLCVNPAQIIDISHFVDADGNLTWKAPAGNWTILRMGHTSTGHTNATGGGGIGLELDKFNPKAVELHFNSWLGEILKRVGAENRDAIPGFYIDSWECGSQNWSANFAGEFKQRRGYDLMPYLPVMAGVPIESVAKSEQVLYDIRQTIAELVNDVFYKTLRKLGDEQQLSFAAENVAPTMVSDGMLHFKTVDVPMGEFWLNSPTHDKPNDMLDAVSAGHIYGKPIIQAEGFTTVRMDWTEQPGMLKTLQDRNYALGLNKLVYHVYTLNPWLDKKPGMTLDGVGLYFQRDQTWWKPGKAWVNYAYNVQKLLQKGVPVRDIAVFTGDEVPRRSLLPDRFVSTLPGIFGAERVASEKLRYENRDVPLQKIPKGVTNTANGFQAEKWVNPLQGYAYDSFNPDALQNAVVKDGRVKFSKNGVAYKILVLPVENLMNPSNIISEATINKISELEQQGIAVIKDKPYTKADFSEFGIEKDLIVTEDSGVYAQDIAFNHRSAGNEEIYFISNQQEKERLLTFSFRHTAAQAQFYDPVWDKWSPVNQLTTQNNRSIIPIKLAPAQSLFVVFNNQPKGETKSGAANWKSYEALKTIGGSWTLKFDENYGGPTASLKIDSLKSWTSFADSAVKYYSGTVVYSNTFKLKRREIKNHLYLNLGEMHDLASIKVNGQQLGTVWTAPHRIDISKALKKGENSVEISLTNTWHNRLIGDQTLPESKRITHTTAPYRLEGDPLLPAGLLGPVVIEKELK